MYKEYRKNSKSSNLKAPQYYESVELKKILAAILKKSPKGWDGTFIRQLERWRSQAESRGRSLLLNKKQLKNLARIEQIYLTTPAKESKKPALRIVTKKGGEG